MDSAVHWSGEEEIKGEEVEEEEDEREELGWRIRKKRHVRNVKKKR